jgi:photosystem II stability/assembly factor-like uncharacterized protein
MKKLHTFKSIILCFILLITANETIAQWSTLSTGTNLDFDKVHFTSTNVGFALPYKGPIFKTIDGGVTWDSLSSTTLNASQLFENQIWFINEDLGFISTHQGLNVVLLKTENGGLSWINITPEAGITGEMKVQFIDSQVGFIYSNFSNDDRFWITNNGGQSWLEKPLNFNLGSGSGNIPSMHFVNENTGYLFGGDGSFNYKGVIAQTTNAGQSWNLTTLPNINSLIRHLHFTSQDTGFAITGNGQIIRTNDGGNSWNNANDESELFFTNNLHGYAITDSNVYVTHNAGVSWNIDFTAPKGTVLSTIDFSDNQTVYISGSKGTILKKKLSLSINESSNTINPNIYPNPTSEKLFLTNNHLVISCDIYHVNGKKCISVNNGNPIDISALSGGTYLIVIHTKEQEHMLKFIKQ